METEKKNCYSCAYKGSVLGSAHSRCHFDFLKAKIEVPAGDYYGVKMGWWRFPINYDPVWMRGECKAWSKEKNADLFITKYDPLVELLGLLR